MVVNEDCGQDYCDSEADTVKEMPAILSLGLEDEEPIGEQEAIMFAKWEKYMKNKGLVRVEKGKKK